MLNILLLLICIGAAVWAFQHYTLDRRIKEFFKKAKLGPYRVPDYAVTQHTYLMSHMGRFIEPELVLPLYFKWKENILVPIRDQGKCASCWAFAVSDCLADRLSILTGGQTRESLSVQELVSCFNRHVFHCRNGGIPELAYQYVITHGLSSESSYPYEQLTSRVVRGCKVSSPLLEYIFVDKYRAERNPGKVYGIQGSAKNLCFDIMSLPQNSDIYKERLKQNVQNMKTEIFLHGPIVGTMYVHKDLYQYDGKRVYSAASDSPLMGGHAIEIFGWCEAGENTKEAGFHEAYWICRNSWGLKWPKTLPYGLMYVRMGTNESGIESRASSIVPLMNARTLGLSASVTVDNQSYKSYADYVNDPQRVNFISTDTRAEQFT